MSSRMLLRERLPLHAPHLPSKQAIPAFVYGTAWKKDATAELVFQALSNGFTAIDTACQPKHYREDLVGQGLRRALNQTSLKRSEIYIQTKFTSVDGQDPNDIPYNPRLPVTEQVKQSVARSLKNFDISHADGSNDDGTYLDTVVLHSPMSTIDETMDVWRTLETYVPNKIRNLGISNCDLHTLMDVYERATIKPAVVQNRFYPRTRFDIGVRRFCHKQGIVYQSFWTLSANPELLRSKPVQQMASNLRVGRESALYCLVLGLGNLVVLNGTTNVQHMRDDFAALKAANEFASSNAAVWQSAMVAFRSVLGEPPVDGQQS